MAPQPLERNTKIGIVVGATAAVGIVITVLCFVFLGGKSPDTNTLSTTSTSSTSRGLEEFSALLTPDGKLEGADLAEFKSSISSLPSEARAKAIVARPELIQVVIGNNISMDFTKLDAEQSKVFKEELGKLEKDPKLPESVKMAAKKMLDEMKNKNENIIKNAPNGSSQQSSQEQVNGTGQEVVNTSADKTTEQSGLPDSGQVAPQGDATQTLTPAQQDQKKDSAEYDALFAKPFLTPKEADKLFKEVSAGNLLKPDGTTKYASGDIQPKCVIAPLIKPLIEATDPKALPDLAPIRNTITTVVKELKEVTDPTVKGFFGDFNHADDKAVIAAHLSPNIENLIGPKLATRFALLQSIDPTTYTNEHAKDTLLQKVLSATTEERVNTHGVYLEEFLNDRKELILFINGTSDVDKMITDAKAVISTLEKELQVLLENSFLKPDEAIKALDLTTKTGNRVENDIKQKCELRAFIADLMNNEDPENTPRSATLADLLSKVKDMRTIIHALPDTDPKPFYDSFMKNAAGLFTNE